LMACFHGISILVPKLRLGTHCPGGSASPAVVRIPDLQTIESITCKSLRDRASPAGVPRQSLGTS
jgi:hypothetical protein